MVQSIFRGFAEDCNSAQIQPHVIEWKLSLVTLTLLHFYHSICNNVNVMKIRFAVRIAGGWAQHGRLKLKNNVIAFWTILSPYWFRVPENDPRALALLLSKQKHGTSSDERHGSVFVELWDFGIFTMMTTDLNDYQRIGWEKPKNFSSTSIQDSVLKQIWQCLTSFGSFLLYVFCFTVIATCQFVSPKFTRNVTLFFTLL